MKTIFLLILLGFSSLIYSQEFPVLKGDYLGQTPPGIIPEVFVPGLGSVNNRMELGCSFSRDGKEFAFGVARSEEVGSIYYMKQNLRRIKFLYNTILLNL